MALPTSGPLSISMIRTELGSSSGSLRALSALASFSTPDAISEFYGYSAAVTVNITAYYPAFMQCSSLYTFAATSSIAVNTNVNVSIQWEGDLGGFLLAPVTISSGTTCGSDLIDSGSGISCFGEVFSSGFVSLFPQSNGNQIFVHNLSSFDNPPC